jgi:hypothetical protein
MKEAKAGSKKGNSDLDKQDKIQVHLVSSSSMHNIGKHNHLGTC